MLVCKLYSALWLGWLLGFFPCILLPLSFSSQQQLGQRLHWCVVMPMMGSISRLSLGSHTHAHTHHSSTSGKTARASTRPPCARAHCRRQLTAAAAAWAHLGRGLASTRAALSHKETQNPGRDRPNCAKLYMAAASDHPDHHLVHNNARRHNRHTTQHDARASGCASCQSVSQARRRQRLMQQQQLKTQSA